MDKTLYSPIACECMERKVPKPEMPSPRSSVTRSPVGFPLHAQFYDYAEDVDSSDSDESLESRTTIQSTRNLTVDVNYDSDGSSSVRSLSNASTENRMERHVYFATSPDYINSRPSSDSSGFGGDDEYDSDADSVSVDGDSCGLCTDGGICIVGVVT